MNSFSLTASLADFCTKLDSEVFDLKIAPQVGRLLLDFLGVAARGAQSPSTKVLLDLYDTKGPGARDVGIIATPRASSPLTSALIHGTAAHSLELDDLHSASSIHPAVVVFPAAVAAAQMVQTPPSKFISAIVAGYEVATRVSQAANPAKHYGRGFHPTATCGVFGSAAAAGTILGLSADRLAQAWGICGSMSAGSLAFLCSDSWTKHLQAGWASYAGLHAAMLAHRGFSAPRDIFGGRFGFFHSYADDPRPYSLLEGIGDRWAVMDTSLKPHACCRYMQPAIDGLKSLANDNDLNPGNIESVTVHCIPAGFALIAEPTGQKADPRSPLEAQFSMPFGASVALARRRAGIEDFSEEALNDPMVLELLPKVRCVRDEELGSARPERWSAYVVVNAMNGLKLSRKVEAPKGDPVNPFSEAELVEKFEELTAPCYAPKRRRRLVEAGLGVGMLKSLDKLWRLLPAEE